MVLGLGYVWAMAQDPIKKYCEKIGFDGFWGFINVVLIVASFAYIIVYSEKIYLNSEELTKERYEHKYTTTKLEHLEDKVEILRINNLRLSEENMIMKKKIEDVRKIVED